MSKIHNGNPKRFAFVFPWYVSRIPYLSSLWAIQHLAPRSICYLQRGGRKREEIESFKFIFTYRHISVRSALPGLDIEGTQMWLVYKMENEDTI